MPAACDNALYIRCPAACAAQSQTGIRLGPSPNCCIGSFYRLLSPLQRSRGSGLQRCDNQRRRLNLLCPAVRADPLSRPDSLEAPSVAITVTPISCCVSSCIAFSRHRASNITLCISANHFTSHINVHNSAALASMALDPVATLRDIC